MYSLSTAWNASRHSSGQSIVDEIKSIGFESIELNFTLTKKIVDDILRLHRQGRVSVSSLHNMCPLPKEIDSDRPSPDHYSLAALDEIQRIRAVEIAKETLDYAARFDATAVVLHAGRVEMPDRMRELASLSDRDASAILCADMIAKRNVLSPRHLDRIVLSLKELVPYAQKSGVKLALETRYHYREIPTFEEFKYLFDIFPAGSLFYWHDTGHAATAERLGFSCPGAFVESFCDRLIGIHLHDIIGKMTDHRAPGEGTFDFGSLKPFIKPQVLKVIEVHPPATQDQVRASLQYLVSVLGE